MRHDNLKITFELVFLDNRKWTINLSEIKVQNTV